MSRPAAHDGPPGQSRAVLVTGTSVLITGRDRGRGAATASGHRERP